MGSLAIFELGVDSITPELSGACFLRSRVEAGPEEGLETSYAVAIVQAGGDDSWPGPGLAC